MHELKRFPARIEITSNTITVYNIETDDLVKGTVRLVGVARAMSDGFINVDLGGQVLAEELTAADRLGSLPGLKREGLEVLQHDNDRLTLALKTAQDELARKEALIEELRSAKDDMLNKLVRLAERGLGLEVVDGNNGTSSKA